MTRQATVTRQATATRQATVLRAPSGARSGFRFWLYTEPQKSKTVKLQASTPKELPHEPSKLKFHGRTELLHNLQDLLREVWHLLLKHRSIVSEQPSSENPRF